MGGQTLYGAARRDDPIKAADLTFDTESCHITLDLPSGEAQVSYGYGYYEQGYFPHLKRNALAYSCAGAMIIHWS